MGSPPPLPNKNEFKLGVTPFPPIPYPYVNIRSASERHQIKTILGSWVILFRYPYSPTLYAQKRSAQKGKYVFFFNYYKYFKCLSFEIKNQLSNVEHSLNCHFFLSKFSKLRDPPSLKSGSSTTK